MLLLLLLKKWSSSYAGNSIYGVDALDPLNPAHHYHIGVALCILFFEVMYDNFFNPVMNFMTRIENSYCHVSIHAYDIRIPQCHV